MDKQGIFPATKDHVLQLQGRIRKADCMEAMALCGRDVNELVKECFEKSTLCWVYVKDGVAEAIFGVATTLDDKIGIPWMVGTENIKRLKGGWRNSKDIIAQMIKPFEVLVNFVDARNEYSIKWLKWCGFEFDEYPQPYGISKLPFYRFFMRKEL